MPVVGRIIPEEKSLKGLLSDDNRMFEIPKYQRKYSWRDEALEFLEDILTIAQNKEYFIGPMIFIENESRSSSNIRVYGIIDGQQRLITTAMIIAIVRDILNVFSKLTNDQSLSGDAQNAVAGLNRLIQLTNYRGVAVGSKFRYSYYDEQILKLLIDKGVSDLISDYLVSNANGSFVPTQIAKYLRNVLFNQGYKKYSTIISTYLDLFEEIPHLLFEVSPEEKVVFDSRIIKQVDRFIEVILQNVKTVVLIVNNENDAFLIFETLNDRGVRLGPLDLIKNYLLRILAQSGNEDTLVRYSNMWDELTGDNRDAERYVLYYLIVKKQEKISKKDIYKEIKQHIQTPEDVIAFMNDLEKIFDYETELKNRLSHRKEDLEIIFDILSSLQSLRVKQHLPIVFSLILCESDPKFYRKYLEDIYYLALRFKVTKTNWNRLEKKLGKLVHSICEGDYNSYRDTLLEILPSSEVTKQAFLEYQAKKRNDTVAREVLRRINSYILSQKSINIKPKKTLTVEHLIPVSKDNKPEINMFGNLILVTRGLNSELKDKDLPEKLRILKKRGGQDLPLNTFMVSGGLDIKKRTQKLAELFVKATSIQ